MPTIADFATRGKITQARDRSVTFKPTGTNYAMTLTTSEPYAGPIDTPVRVTLRVSARKVYSVPSGGNFVAPIFGPPKIIQGRVIHADAGELIIHAGANFSIRMPAGASAIDLNSGAIAVGTMVNVVAFPGATLELAEEA